MTLDLYSPDGAYNKVLMTGNSGGAGECAFWLRTQVELLSSQVKTLTGNDLGEKGIDVNDPVLTLLREDVARLALDNQTIKASLGGEIVRISNEAFHSPDEVKRWIVDNVGPDPGTYKFFFDVTSMLESLQDAERLSDEAMDLQAILRKANHRSISAGRMLNSFGISIPQVMNKKNHPEPFSHVGSYDKWKTDDGRSGLKDSKGPATLGKLHYGNAEDLFCCSRKKRYPLTSLYHDEQVHDLLDVPVQLDRRVLRQLNFQD
jgi:hypothetical protein